MSPAGKDPIADAAIDWIMRLSAPDFGDWAAFETWLGADPAHAETYWRLAALDRDLAPVVAQNAESRKTHQDDVVELSAYRRPRRGAAIIGWGIGAAAAAIALIVGGYALQRPSAPEVVAIETAPGKQRLVELPDGTRVALNGGTRVTFDRAQSRNLRLERGEARFDVTHDAARPFVLHVGEASLVDLGTSFDVVREAGETRVAVAEGAVRFERGGSAHDLRAGESLRISDTDARPQLGRIDAATISGWRSGRLVYENAPVSIVAGDLARTLGIRIAVAPDVAKRVFTGGIATRGDAAQVMNDAAATIGVRAEQGPDGWIVDDKARSRR